MYTQEGVSSAANFITAYESLNKTETPIFYSVMCSLSLKVTFLTFILQIPIKETYTLFKKKKVTEKSRKPQFFLDTKRKRKQTKPNQRESNKRTKSTMISSLFPKRGNRNAKRTENARTK